MKASRFLLKDDLEQTLSECVEDILREERVVEFGFVEGNVRLRVDDIIYIETSKHKNVFCTAGRHTASIRRWMSIFKKVIIFSLVAVGHIVDTHIIGEGSVLRTAVIFFYLSNEGISILENAARTGLPIPGKLKAVLEQLREEKEN